VRPHDQGAHWDPPVVLADRDDGLGEQDADRIALTWSGDDRALHWLRVDDPAAPPRAVTVPGGDAHGACDAHDRLWLIGDDRRLRAVGAASQETGPEVETGGLIACTARAVVWRGDYGVAVCTATQCGPTSVVPHDAFVELGPHDELVTATQDQQNVTVTVAGRARLYRIGDQTLDAVVTWGDRIYLGLEARAGVGFVALPDAP
jgi:hypothetical protein